MSKMDGEDAERLPIWSSLDVIERRFGFDIMFFHFLSREILLFLCFYGVGNLITVILFGIMDFLSASSPLAAKVNAVAGSYLYGMGQLIVQLVLGICFIIFNKYAIIARRRFAEACWHADEDVSEYTILILNVRKQWSDKDLIHHIEKSVRLLEEQAALRIPLAHKALPIIAHFERVSDPHIYDLRVRLATLQKEFYEAAKDKGDALTHDGSKAFRCLKALRLIRLWQRFGAFRDLDYYTWQLERYREQIRQRRERVERRGCLVPDVVIVTFSLSAVRHAVVENFKRATCCSRLRFNRTALTIRAAPRVSDLIWSNLHRSNFNTFLCSVGSMVACLGITAVVFALILVLRGCQRHILYTTNSGALTLFLNAAIYLVIFACDFIFRPVLSLLVGLEGHHTHTAKESSYMFRYFIYTFFNRLTPLYSRRIYQAGVRTAASTVQNFLDIIDYTPYWRWGGDSPGRDMLFYMVMNNVVYNPMLLAINTLSWSLLSCTNVCAKTSRGWSVTTLGFVLRYSVLYSQLATVVFYVIAYSYAHPVLIPLGIIYLLVNDVISRYLLFRVSRMPPRLSGILAVKFCRYLLPFGSLFLALCLAQGYLGASNTPALYLGVSLGITIVLQVGLNSHLINHILRRCKLYKRATVINSMVSDKELAIIEKLRQMPPYNQEHQGLYLPNVDHLSFSLDDLAALKAHLHEGESSSLLEV